MTPPGPSPHVWPRAQLAPSDAMLRKRALFHDTAAARCVCLIARGTAAVMSVKRQHTAVHVLPQRTAGRENDRRGGLV